MRWLFVLLRRRLHPGLDRLCGERQFPRPGRMAGAAGLFRRHADPGGVRGGLPALPASAPGACDDHRRRPGGARADRRTDRRRLDHRDLLLALAVPDQCPSRHRLGAFSPAASCHEQPTRLARGSQARRPVAGPDGDLRLAALEIALKQAPDRGWTSGLVLGLLALSVASAVGFVRRTLARRAPIVDLSTFARPAFRDRLRPELRPRDRPVRLGLPDAGLPRLRQRPQRARDRRRSCWSPASRNC